MRSSYKQNNYGEVFYELVIKLRPKLIVELGILDGYSTVHLAEGLKNNKCGRIDAYDLFEDYPFKHSNYSEIVEKYKEIECLKIFKADAFTVHDRYENDSVDILHVDLSNDGSTIRKIMQLWNDKITEEGIIIFEGGSYERDQVDWMKLYNKEPIRDELLNNFIVRSNYTYETYTAFPSLTVLTKMKREQTYE